MNNPFKKNGAQKPRRAYDPQAAQRRQAEFMSGRNGVDSLGRFAFIIACVVFVISFFFRDNLVFDMAASLIAFALMAYAIWRSMSRNVSKRYLENARYQNVVRKVKAPFARIFPSRTARPSAGPSSAPKSSTDSQAGADNAWARLQRDRAARKKYGKDFKFFKCPQCGHTLRVPKGKGKIKITCPNCSNRFEAKS